MKTKPDGAYIYQPLPANAEGGKCFGVGGISNIVFKGVTKEAASEAARVCNENTDFARNFLIRLAEKLGADCYDIDFGTPLRNCNFIKNIGKD